ncbi:hypothetical protein TWF481_000215 [Arthrobotrys musiformis]|uniref:Uncharacterized protein n=1 Tax=Arthrobotrys musiformis TaxID=47236 RepID=A0AAV9WMW3_9PEZI
MEIFKERERNKDNPSYSGGDATARLPDEITVQKGKNGLNYPAERLSKAFNFEGEKIISPGPYQDVSLVEAFGEDFSYTVLDAAVSRRDKHLVMKWDAEAQARSSYTDVPLWVYTSWKAGLNSDPTPLDHSQENNGGSVFTASENDPVLKYVSIVGLRGTGTARFLHGYKRYFEEFRFGDTSSHDSNGASPRTYLLKKSDMATNKSAWYFLIAMEEIFIIGTALNRYPNGLGLGFIDSIGFCIDIDDNGDKVVDIFLEIRSEKSEPQILGSTTALGDSSIELFRVDNILDSKLAIHPLASLLSGRSIYDPSDDPSFHFVVAVLPLHLDAHLPLGDDTVQDQLGDTGDLALSFIFCVSGREKHLVVSSLPKPLEVLPAVGEETLGSIEQMIHDQMANGIRAAWLKSAGVETLRYVTFMELHSDTRQLLNTFEQEGKAPKDEITAYGQLDAAFPDIMKLFSLAREGAAITGAVGKAAFEELEIYAVEFVNLQDYQAIIVEIG